VIEGGAVAIQGSNILDVGTDAELAALYAPSEVIDAGGGVVHPGFVESHTHVSNHLTRGAFKDTTSSTDYFAQYTRWFNALTDEHEHVSALFASVEMLHAGVTTFMDAGTIFETHAAADAAEQVGIRALIGGPFVWDTDDNEWTRAIRRMPCTHESALERVGSELWRNADPDARVRGHVALWGLGTASDALLSAAKSCADQNATTLTMHQSLERRDVQRDLDRLGKAPLTHFHDTGLLAPNVSLAHMNYLSPPEIEAVADSGASVVWNPGNFLFYAIGSQTSCPVPELCRQGANVALGTDVAKAWSYADQAWLGYLVARLGDDRLSPETVFGMATTGGARAVGMESSIGSIEVGKKADLVIRDPLSPESHPGLDPIHQLVLLQRNKDVESVIVGGRVVLRAGRSTQVDEASVFESARRATHELAELADLGLPDRS
jgi:5-methylthioadenosine/S-adenosylhomocysteine deaminase